MRKKYSSILATIFIAAVLSFLYFTMMPKWTSNDNIPFSEFSTKRAYATVKAISKKPHFVGSKNHELVANYLIKELQNLGLETTIQEGYTLSNWGNLVKSKNILARIKGTSNSKALLLLSHYDSAPHSYSHGASDAGSGVATILEGVRTFLHNKTPHKNDIIILFSDAEELGLNGAALFVTKHNWANEIGLVLNFEARGTSGPSYMLMETNNGNAALVKEFSAANVDYPVSNSLMYSIYKMLPNDTDLTVFRQQKNIQGYNFAFIDGHYNYHTAQDDLKHLNTNTLAHQGTYLIPLLNYFSNTNLNTTHSTADYVYFTIPFAFISYPFYLVLPLFIFSLLLFLFFVFIGIAKRILIVPEMIKGLIPLFGSLITTGVVTYFGWKGLLLAYPQYNDLLNGFTYNGYTYISAFVFLALSITFLFYNVFSIKKVRINHYVAPLFIWLLINGVLSIYLKGAGFLIIPVYFGLFILGYYINTQKSNKTLNLAFSIPALLIIVPFIQMFPVGLGLKVLFGSAILTVLTTVLLLPIFSTFRKKGTWSMVFLLIAIGFFTKAHYESGYEEGKAKSNSLLYVYNVDTNKASWLTYDINLDPWTKEYLGEDPKNTALMQDTPLASKYNSGFTYAAQAPKKIISVPSINFLQDSIADNQRYLKIRIAPNRKVNRYDIFANEKMVLNNFTANGASQLEHKGTKFNRKGNIILSYYVVDNEPLEMQFSINASTVFEMELLESSFDLMSNPLFNITKRASWMMPTPFVLNDAVVIKQKIIPGQITRAPIPIITQKQTFIKKVRAILPRKANTEQKIIPSFKKFEKPPLPIIQKEQRRIIIANDKVKTK
jgi:hypothetical protein